MQDHERLAAAMRALCWGPRGLAEAMDIRYDTAKRWLLGRAPIPAAVLAWAERLAAAHRADPPPKGTPRADPFTGEVQIPL